MCTSVVVLWYSFEPEISPGLLALFRHAGSLLSMAQDCLTSSFSVAIRNICLKRIQGDSPSATMRDGT